MCWLFALALVLLMPDWAMAQNKDYDATQVDANNLYSEPYLTIESGGHLGGISGIDADAENRFLISGARDGIRVWAANDGQLLQTIRLARGPGATGKILAVAISPDGKKIAATYVTSEIDGPSSILIIDRVSATITKSIDTLNYNPRIIKFSRDGSLIYVGFLESNGIGIYDSNNLSLIKKTQVCGDFISSIDISESGNIIVTSGVFSSYQESENNFRSNICLFDRNLLLLAQKKIFGSNRPVAAVFSPDVTKIAVAYFGKEPEIFSVNDIDQPIKKIDKTLLPDNPLMVRWLNKNGQYILFDGIRFNNKKTGESTVTVTKGLNTVVDLIDTGFNSTSDIKLLNNGNIAVSNFDTTISVYSSSFSRIWRSVPEIIDFREESKPPRFRISKDGKYVEFGNFRKPQNKFMFDLSQMRLSLNSESKIELSDVKVNGISSLIINDGKVPTLNGKNLPVESSCNGFIVSVAEDSKSFLLNCGATIYKFLSDGKLVKTINIPIQAWGLNQNKDGTLAVVTLNDGSIRWYGVSDGAEKLALYVNADGKRWVAWTPSGYYAASIGGEDLIRWVVNRGRNATAQEYPIGAYREKRYRPDVIAAVLDTLDINRAVQLADAARGRKSAVVTAADVVQKAPLVVTILDPDDGTTVRNSPLEVGYRISGRPGETIKRLRALVNNRETAFQRDLLIPANGMLEGTLKVSFEGIAPVLQLYAANEFADSAPATVKLSGGIEPKDKNKPVLYVLAIGISEYRNRPDINLKFADDDARAFVERMRTQKGGLYRDVVLRSLIDRDATTAAIRESLSWLQRQMGDSDVAAIFISAHGETDGRGDLYLISNDADVRDEVAMRQTAVQWDDVYRDIKDLASRGKVLVFLDACKSGQVIPGKRALPPDIDRAVNELRESGNDVTIFSSSTGTQLSREEPKYGHGFFTYSLLEALDGKGMRSGDYVTTGDLNRYISARVKSLTDGAQTPVVSTPLSTTSSPPLFVIR
jgi:hypothetical protein